MPDVSVFRANDLSPQCRVVLLNHRRPCRTEPVQGNMRDRVKNEVIEKMRREFAEMQTKHGGSSSSDRGQKKDEMRRVGQAFLHFCTQTLMNDDCWNDVVHCYACGQDCAFPEEMQQVGDRGPVEETGSSGQLALPSAMLRVEFSIFRFPQKNMEERNRKKYRERESQRRWGEWAKRAKESKKGDIEVYRERETRTRTRSTHTEDTCKKSA